MITVEDRSQPGEIVCQVFNFVDVLGGANNINVEGKKWLVIFECVQH